MTSLISSQGSSPEPYSQELKPEMGFLQSLDGEGDPIEAYFECITQCSLDDGECVTVCTTILREMS